MWTRLLKMIKNLVILFFFREKSFRDKWITEHRLLKVQNFYCGVALLTTRDMVHGKWKLSTLPLVSAYH
jgi:hypothetical protein